MTVGTTTRLQLTTWSQDEDPVSRVQFDTSHTNLETLAAKCTTGTSLPAATSAFARAFFYDTNTTTLYFCPTGSAWVTVGVGTDFVRTTATQTLTNKTLTAPVISTISNTGTITLPTSTDTLVGRATTDTLTNKTLTAPAINAALLKSPEEVWTVSNAAPTAAGSGDQAIYIEDSSARLFTSNATANFVFNITGSSTGTTLTSLLDTNTSITIAIGVTNGASAYYCTGVKIDGTTVTPKWQGANTPSSGNANSIDVYSFSIVKTSSGFTVLASQTRFG